MPAMLHQLSASVCRRYRSWPHWQSSKSVLASTRLEDPSNRRGRPNRHQSLPAPRERGLIQPFFLASRPMDPLMWLAGLLALSGDVETNPGPSTQTWTCDMCSTEHSINNNKTQQQINSKKTITIIQININGLTTKIHELKNLTDNTKIDIITIQETKLKLTHRTPYLIDYTAIRTDRTYKNGGGLMTYIKNDIIFTELKTPHTTNHKLTELQHIKIHIANHKHLNIFNIYIPPRDTTNPDHSNSQEDITNCMMHILNTNNTILTGDFNAHHTLTHHRQ